MKSIPWLLLSFGLSTAALADSYQYQYPTDPYSPTPKPQPTYSGGSSSGAAYGYDKLLSYGSLELRYNYNDFKDAGLNNSSGISAGLRAPLFKPLFLNFGVNWITGSDESDRSFDLTVLTAGVGAYLPVASRFHLFGEVGLRYDISGGVLSDLNPDSFAVYLRPGLRFAATEKLEIAGSVLFSTTDNYDKHVFELNGYFALLSVLDVGLGVDFASDVNSYHAGLRLRW